MILTYIPSDRAQMYPSGFILRRSERKGPVSFSQGTTAKQREIRGFSVLIQSPYWRKGIWEDSKEGEVSVWGRKCFPILQRSLTHSANIHSTSPLSWRPRDGQAPARDEQNDLSY